MKSIDRDFVLSGKLKTAYLELLESRIALFINNEPIRIFNRLIIFVYLSRLKTISSS